jgi:hypothetical protein
VAQTRTSSSQGRKASGRAAKRSTGTTQSRSNPNRGRANASNRSTATRVRAKTNSRSTGTRGRANASRSNATRARSNASGSRSNANRSRSTASRGRSASRARSSRKANNGSVRQTLTSGAQSAAQGVAGFAKKARTPLLTGGAAVAGVAGAVVLSNRSGHRRKVLGVPLPKRNGLKVDAQKVTEAITDAAKRADRIGQRVSRVAGSVQDVSETANATAKKS